MTELKMPGEKIDRELIKALSHSADLAARAESGVKYVSIPADVLQRVSKNIEQVLNLEHLHWATKDTLNEALSEIKKYQGVK